MGRARVASPEERALAARAVTGGTERVCVRREYGFYDGFL